MPVQLLKFRSMEHIPGTDRSWDYWLSIVRFDPKEGEEVFLSYSRGVDSSPDFQHGPGIVRDGKGPPWMRRYDDPHEITTDPNEQRVGTWAIDEESRNGMLGSLCEHRDEAEQQLQQAKKRLKKANKNLGAEATQEAEKEVKTKDDNLERWDRFINLAGVTPSHEDWFQQKYPEYQIIGEQGCGDLTMNSWYVSFIRSRLTDDQPRLIHLRGEPMETRTYTCLVKRIDREPHTLEIRDIRFHPYRADQYRVISDNEPIADKLEFAVYGKAAIRNGCVLDFREDCHQYSDIRHLFLLPDLNPNRRGSFFGQRQEGAIYFGEAQLLSDRNLRRAALSGPIELDRLYAGMGASTEQVRNALKGLDYDEAPLAAGLLRQGEWRFVPEDDKLVDIFLKRSQYGCTMIGIDDKDGIICLAFNARAWDRVGDTIESAASKLMEYAERAGYRVKDALIFDEGADVFQRVRFKAEDKLNDTVPLQPGRRQIRGMFLIAKKVPQ